MISIIQAIASFFVSCGIFVLACGIIAASAAASAWCSGFLGSVLAVGVWRKTEDRGIAVGAPIGAVLGALLALWQIFAGGLLVTVVTVIGFCGVTLVVTALAFILCPPPPLPFGDDGLTR
ncbi:MAG: hypothetical protein JSS83_27970 [Cyanobacteria bacterium SZAS LIN-3]|nr:hypothetical protein [Cyanobacteria bacterium SZAS LIN-3]